ncbi:hypothetical protein D8B46_02175 [Candidatus Gracilibacteria bacterium]|nr:MAG: hypothetical protein D8B46_02175 [Candidatus Gracilibacteria bacterium]
MLEIVGRNGDLIKKIYNYNISQFNFGKINHIEEIEGNAGTFLGKICNFYDLGKLVGSGIIESYQYNKNLNKSSIELYPLHYDLRRDFLDNGNAGEFIKYFDSDLIDVLDYIITQYRNKVAEPVLYMKKPFQKTNIKVKYTFSYKTLLEAWNILFFSFLPKEKNIKIHPDGGIEIINNIKEKNLFFKKDVLNLSFSEKADEIINYIIFENKLPGVENIKKIYQDNESIEKFGRRVKYWSDKRIKYIETANLLVGNFLEKNKSPKIEIEEIKTDRLDIDIYDKINISNWDKNFDNVFVIGVSYLKGGMKLLKVGSELTRQILSLEDDFDSISESLEEIAGSLPTLPDYIKETYIDSTEIRSPNIAGNNGYFSNYFKVGPEGIVINGKEKKIYSSNYSKNQEGWCIDNEGNAEFNHTTLRGDLKAGTININNNFTVDENGNTRGNNFINKTILFEKLGQIPDYQDGKLWCEDNLPDKKVLWGYFGGDSQKQQISTSRMQYSTGFDRTDSGNLRINTWFQPRVLLFTGFFTNISKEIYGTTSGHAGSVSFMQGACNSYYTQLLPIEGIITELRTERNSRYIQDDLTIGTHDDNKFFHFSRGSCNDNVDACVRGSYIASGNLSYSTSMPISDINWNISTIRVSKPFVSSSNNGFGASTHLGEVLAYVSEWSNNGINIQINIASGRRLCGNFTILG